MALWEYLKEKYTLPSQLAAVRYTRELHGFTWTDESTIINAWNKLKETRRKIVNAKPSTRGQYDDASLLIILTSALPETYQSTVDTLNIQTNLTVEDQLKHLQNKEERITLSAVNTDKESGHAARSRRRSREFSKRRRSSTHSSHRRTCLLCGDDDHYFKACPLKSDIQKFVKQLKSKPRDQGRHRKPWQKT